MGFVALAVGVVITTGVVNVAADVPHSPLTLRVLEYARERSIAVQLRDIQIPQNLADSEQVRRGAGNYAAMCANCHLAPGVADSEIRSGLYPKPPRLAEPSATSQSRNAARDFWIIKHGIKASGMPAWAPGGMEDDAIWDLAAFLQRLPALSKEAYEQLVASSGGHFHAGMTGHGNKGKAAHGSDAVSEKLDSKPKRSHSHDHSNHAH